MLCPGWLPQRGPLEKGPHNCCVGDVRLLHVCTPCLNVLLVTDSTAVSIPTLIDARRFGRCLQWFPSRKMMLLRLIGIRYGLPARSQLLTTPPPMPDPSSFR